MINDAASVMYTTWQWVRNNKFSDECRDFSKQEFSQTVFQKLAQGSSATDLVRVGVPAGQVNLLVTEAAKEMVRR